MSRRPVKIAILAMGGEGGGVLADWIVSAAEEQGFFAQSTSVPGVAQRTGATIYYVEILEVQRGEAPPPVLGLMPTPGDVDVVIASELMESARAVQRGLVTPDKTLLITSSSRTYSLTEKMGMGDGRVDSDELRKQGKDSAKTFVARDFARIATDHKSVISASLFGALAASGSMPFGRAVFEDAIERGGLGVASSLRAFAAGHDAWFVDERRKEVNPLPALDPRLSSLGARVQRDFPLDAQEVVLHGVIRTADYQDQAYAAEYLDRLSAVADLPAVLDGNTRLLRETARYLALWMTYEDMPRVAELKLRKSRFERVRRDVKAGALQLVRINEFFHPRLEEIADSMPSSLGRWLMRTGFARGVIRMMTSKGRVIQTSNLGGFAMLYAVFTLKRLRRSSLRYHREVERIEHWLHTICETSRTDAILACEIAECQRLIKGYGDTHARGMNSFNKIISTLPLLVEGQAAFHIQTLRQAALADDSGSQLDEAIERVIKHSRPNSHVDASSVELAA